jgi:hypothetical protein
MLFMTVPTAAARPELLTSLIDNCGLPREQIIVVSTREGIDLPVGAITIEDLGTPNIQRWWARGIAEAEKRGATTVAVVNDDISLTPQTLGRLSDALTRTGAAIASPSRPSFKNGLHKRPLVPYEPRLWGSLWVLRLNSGLRPDERYVWWYGDNDLDIRARRHHGGVVLEDVEYEHLHPGEGTAKSPELQAQADRDAQRFETQYARLLRTSRFLARWQQRLLRTGR